MGIPVTTSPVFLFYHKPVFARDNLTVPVTWEQVLALAERYNGTGARVAGRRAIKRDGVESANIRLTD